MQVRPTLQRRYRESLRALNLVVLCVVGEFSSELCRAYAFCRGRIFFAQGTKMAAFSPVFRVVVFSCALRKRVRTKQARHLFRRAHAGQRIHVVASAAQRTPTKYFPPPRRGPSRSNLHVHVSFLYPDTGARVDRFASGKSPAGPV